MDPEAPESKTKDASSPPRDFSLIIEGVVSAGRRLIKDHRTGFFGTKHPKCMAGNDFVAWLVENGPYGIRSESGAVEAAQSMMKAGLLQCVSHEALSEFKNSSKHLYRLNALERAQCACGVADHWRKL